MFTTYSNGTDYILLLKADEFLRDRAILAALRNFDGLVVGMATNPALVPHRFFDHVLTGDPHRSDDALKAVREFELLHGLKPKAVIPITEMSLFSASSIAQAYDLPFLSEKCVTNCRGKIEMKEAFAKFGVSTPAYQAFSTFEQLSKVSEKIGYPMIIKPSAAAHSIGIRRIDREEDLEEGFNYCQSGVQSISDEWSVAEGFYQVEEYIESEQEISVEVINNGTERCIIAMTDKSLTPPPFFAETGHMVPSIETNNQKVRQLSLDACKALDITHGICHVEIRIDNEGVPFVIEVAARPGGDGIMDLVERAYGINLYDLHIKSYLGVLTDLPKESPEPIATAAIAFMPTRVGIIKKVAKPKLPEEVVSIYITGKEGSKVEHSLNYDDRLGTVEFYWPKQVKGLSGQHLKVAERLCDEIFEIEAI